MNIMNNYPTPKKYTLVKTLEQFVNKNPKTKAIRSLLSDNNNHFIFRNCPAFNFFSRLGNITNDDDEMLQRRLCFFNLWNISYIPIELKNFILNYCSNKIYFNFTRARWQEISPFCTFCRINGVNNPAPDTLQHFLCECPYTTAVIQKFLPALSAVNEPPSITFAAGAPKSSLQIFINIEILTLIFYLYKSKLAKRNPSFASLRYYLNEYRREMSSRSKVYRSMMDKAKHKLDPSYLTSYI